MSFVNKRSFIFLSHLYAFDFFSCLIALVRTFSTIVNKDGESGHYFLVPILGGKHCFSQLSMVFAVRFCRRSLPS